MLASYSFFLSIITLSQAAFFYPDATAALLEHILVDTHGAKASNFTSAITPCSNYVTAPGPAGALIGRTTAAQWIRVAFHDFVTANATAGSGGMDASIGFETLRDEDSGNAFNDSLTFWRPFVNSFVSMADMVAISTVMSVQNCGGPQIPFKAGRIDATGPGDFGVPAPETDLETTLSYFAKSGFNQVDSIGLTACGHTLGSIHHGGFPQVVPASAVTANNTAGGIHLDTSYTTFDDGVVQEYLSGTGQGGGPLVTTANETTRSDLRLYESDNNATMEALGALGNTGFVNTCVELLGRMINTVPATVTLGSAITPMSIKPINVSYDLDENSNLIFKGSIRTLTPTSTNTPTTVTLSLANNFTTTLSPENATGSSIYGTTTYFPFMIDTASNEKFKSLVSRSSNSIRSDNASMSLPFTISAADIGSQTFNANLPTAFIMPSHTSAADSERGSFINITVASVSTLDSAALSIKISAPVGQVGTLGPQIDEWNSSNLTQGDIENSWQIWNTALDLNKHVTGLVTIELSLYGQLWDTLLINSGVAGW